VDEHVSCPHGHDVPAGATLCPVCWVRVSGEGKDLSLAGKVESRVPMPLIALGVGAVVFIVGVAVALVLSGGQSGDAVAGPDVTTSSAVAPQPAPTPSASGLVSVAAPLAATLADPVSASSSETCRITTRNQSIPCVSDGTAITFIVCVPDETALLEVQYRPTPDATWENASADVELTHNVSCGDTGLLASVSVAFAADPADIARWRLVGRDDAGDRVWKSPLRS